MKLILRRFYEDETQTLGTLLVISDTGLCLQAFATVELPYLANMKNVSSIPEGTYNFRERYSYKFGNHLELLNVKGRSLILIHHGNYHQDTQGCILVGQHHAQLNKDGNLDVVNSKKTMITLLSVLRAKEGTIEVYNSHK